MNNSFSILKTLLACKLDRFNGFICLAVIAFATSCVAPKNIVYLKDIRDTTYNIVDTGFNSPIQKNDIIGISVSSLNPEASTIFNSVTMPIGATGSSGSGDLQAGIYQGSSYRPGGYLVNNDGSISFPVLGNIRAAGLTKSQLSDTLQRVLRESKYLVDPIVTVNFLNFRVTVLGEVNRPGMVNVSNEKINIFEAIGLAGDMTIFAERSKVLLIREVNGTKTVTRVDLTSKNMLNSPFFYLKTNDIIYAEPNKEKSFSVSSTKATLPLIISGLSFIAILINTIVTISK